MLQLHILLIKC